MTRPLRREVSLRSLIMKLFADVLIILLTFTVRTSVFYWAWMDIAVGAFGAPELGLGQLVLGLAAIKLLLGHISFKSP